MAVTAENTVAPEAKIVPVGGRTVDYPVAASTVIYRWSFVGLNASGYLTSHVSPTAALAATGAAPNGTRFVGIATEAIASQTANGDAKCKVQIDGYFEYTLTSLDVVDVGTPLFMSDNSTLTSTARTGACCGYLVQMAEANRGLVRLDRFMAQYTGKMLTVTSAALDCTVAGWKILLVHETQNPTGILLATCSAYNLETTVTSDQEAIVTLQHTSDTSLGCTLTSIDAMALGDVIVGAGGCMWQAGTASDGAIVIVPAGKQVNAEVTTKASEGTIEACSIVICATFLRI